MCAGVLNGSRTALALALTALIARAASPQSAFDITPSMLVAVVSDSNPFARATAAESDVIARVSPVVDVDYRTARVAVLGRIAADAERFAHNTSLTSFHARQQWTVDARYRVQRHLTMRAEASYLQTENPGELNFVSGVTVARGRARRIAVTPTVAYRFSERTESTVRYAASEDRFEGSVPVVTHVATVAAVHRKSPRQSMRVDLFVRRYDFGRDDRSQSQALNVGWAGEVTRRTRLSIAGGPRVTDGSLAPEFSTSLEYGAPGAGFSIGYARVETVLIGLAGAADTDSVSATAFYGRTTGLRLRVAPSVMHTARAGVAARVYRIAIGATRPVSRWLSVDASYEATRQRGDLYNAGPDARISRHLTIVSLSMTPPRRVIP